MNTPRLHPLLPIPAHPSDRDRRRVRAEIAISRILRELETFTEKIDHVTVDTRNFGNLNVQIFFKSEAGTVK